MANLTGITKECWFQIASYLSYVDVLQTACTCRTLGVYCVDSYFWEKFLMDAFIPVPLHGSIGSIENARRMASDIVFNIFDENVRNVLLSALCTSSMDQPAEFPKHTLKKSNCLAKIQKSVTSGRIDDSRRSRQLILAGYYAQQQCGCNGSGSPCYYSSASSPDPDMTEYITYGLYKRPMFVYGFTVTPFQAYFHPDAPVYAPVEVCIQFLHRTTETFTANQVKRLSSEQLTQGVYYQSAFFPVQAISAEQVFCLPSPTLCADSLVRLVFKGMRQRQTLGPVYGEDYYMCISHCAVLAAPIELKLSPDGSGRNRLVMSADAEGEEALPDEMYELLEQGDYDLYDCAEFVLCPEFVRKHGPKRQPLQRQIQEVEYILQPSDDGW